jgi:DNA polymerase
MPNYVAGVGPFEPRLMIIGEAPGKHENDLGEPFVGPTGTLLNDMLYAAGISREECWLTNVVKYQPPFNDFEKLNLIGVDLTQSIESLWADEITRLKPKCILAVGDQALQATTGLTGILNYRGSIILARDGVTKVVPTVHPAALFARGDKEGLAYVYKKLIQSDITRAVEESGSRGLNLPERSIRIAHSSLDLYRFIQEYKSKSRMASDIESINCVPVSISFAFNKHHSLTVPLITRVGNFPLTDMSRRELIECYRLIQELLHEKDIVGQNFKYDQYKLSLSGFRVRRVISDTQLKTQTIFPELPSKSLATQTSIWTREPYYKDDGKENKIGKKFDVERFFIYNGRDSCVTYEIDEAQEEDLLALQDRYRVPLVWFYYNYVMRKHNAYLRLENRGMDIDFYRKKQLKKEYEASWLRLSTKLTEKIGYEVNTKSYPQMYQLLYGAMRFPKRLKDPTSEDAIVALLGGHCKGKDAALKKEILELILEERRTRDQLSRSINFTPDYDLKCRTSFRIEATETARSSTNILKKPIRPKKIGLAFHTIPKHGRLSKSIRSMLVPGQGKCFIQGDLSQAEARVVAVLARDYDLLRAFDEIDIHRRTAGLFFGYCNTLNLTKEIVPIVDYLDKDGPERFTGKMFRHAGNYDMGKRRAMNEFNVNAQKYDIPMSISEWKAGQFIDLFHAASPKIRGVFHLEIREALDHGRCLINPYGRVRIFNGKYEDDFYKEGYAQIPQSTVADTTQNALLDIDDEWVGEDVAYLISENHDALVAEVPINDWELYAESMRKHMTRVIDFEPYCTLKREVKLIIPVDIEVTDRNYGALEKARNFKNYTWTPGIMSQPVIPKLEPKPTTDFLTGLFQ